MRNGRLKSGGSSGGGATSITVKVNNVAKFVIFGVDQAASMPAPKPTVNLSDLVAHWAECDVKQAIDLGIVSGYPKKNQYNKGTRK
jgi:hypothetical protein